MKKDKLITKEKAKELSLIGWNLRCQKCGNYGADFVSFSNSSNSISLCPYHARKLRILIKNYEDALIKICKKNFEQDPPEVISLIGVND